MGIGSGTILCRDSYQGVFQSELSTGSSGNQDGANKSKFSTAKKQEKVSHLKARQKSAKSADGQIKQQINVDSVMRIAVFVVRRDI